MKKYLLSENGQFYKANLHCHSNVSDGKLSPEEIKKIYKEKGYSIVAYTDHEVLVPHSELTDDDFLAMHGYELAVPDTNEEIPYPKRKICHMCFVALDPDNVQQVCYHRTKYLYANAANQRDIIKFDENEPDFEREHTHKCINTMMKKGRDSGFFVTYNHPGWTLENYTDYIGYNHMHAMEICNNGCLVSGYVDYNEKEYDDMLRAGKRIYCIATDDNHNSRNDSFGAWTMIKADNLEYKSVAQALLKGNFYSSQGPEIYELWVEKGKICIKCSEVRRIVLNTDSRHVADVTACDGEFVRYAEFDILPDDIYVRITLTDYEGKHANTNAYFIDKLFE